MIYLVHGEDSFSSNEFLKELLDAIGPEDLRESNLTHIDNNEFTTATLGAACMVTPFLANRRMAIVHGALSSGENRSRTRRAKEKRQPFQKDYRIYSSNYLHFRMLFSTKID